MFENSRHHPLNHIKSYARMIAVVWVIIFVASALWGLSINHQSSIDNARIEARATFNKDLLYRRWAAMHGGVYVPVTEKTQPNPYLDVPARDVTTTDGLQLTLLNPAYMTRQVHEIAQETDGIQGHITSLNPIRPENEPDAWERQALLAFETGEIEVSSIESTGDQQVLRYMQRMVTEQSCMSCHESQGYKVGEIRGGISVTVPMQDFWAAEAIANFNIIVVHIVLCSLGLFGIRFARNRLLRVTASEETITQQLQENEKRYRLALQGTQAGTWEWNVQTGETVFNERWAEIIGYTLAELHPVSIQTWMDYSHPDDLEHSNQLLQQHFSGDAPYYDCEVRMKHKEGHWVWIRDRGMVVEWTDDGQPLMMFGTHIDVTRRKEAEIALRQSEERFHAFITQSNDGIVLVNQNGEVIEWNLAQERITGVKREQVIKQSIVDVQRMYGVDPRRSLEQQEQHEQSVKRALAGEPVEWLNQLIENQICRADQSERTLQTVTFPITLGKNRFLGSVVRDVTEQKQMEEKLRRFSHIVSTTDDSIAILNRDYVYEIANDSYLRLRNRIDEDIIGYHAWEIVGEDIFQMAKPYLEKCLAGETIQYSEWFDVPTMGRVYLLVTYSPDKNEEGHVEGIVVNIRDITEQQKANQQKLDLILERERHHILLNFIQNAAHEFRTPLATINSTSYIMARSGDAERRSEKAEMIGTYVDRITKLVDSLLLISKLGAGDHLSYAPLDINRILIEATERIRTRYPFHEVHLDLDGSLCFVSGDVEYLINALLHLVENAFRFTPEGGEITINSYMRDEQVIIEICDTGQGIAYKDLPHIFETFWRKDKAHQTVGLGLGLPIARKIIEAHGGEIEVQSRENRGSIFRVKLPKRIHLYEAQLG